MPTPKKLPETLTPDECTALVAQPKPRYPTGLRDLGFAVERAQETHLAPLGLLPVVYVVVSSALALVCVSLVSAPPREETLSRFFASR